jgi:hypothetical protein
MKVSLSSNNPKPITMQKVLDFVEVALLLAIGFTMMSFLPS